jgi:hypothetical protein
MTDDELIKRLRSCSSDEAMWSIEAAARIEQLVNDNLRWKMECEKFWRKREDAAEAKLAKAVGLLVVLSNMKTSGNLTATTMAWNAREVLHELEKTE